MFFWHPRCIHLSKPIECPTPGVNPNVSNGLWVIMMCQGRVIHCNKCPTTLEEDVDNGGSYASVGHMGNLCATLSSAVNLELL